MSNAWLAFSLSTLLILGTPVGTSAQENGEEHYCGYDDEGGAQKEGAMLAASVPSAGVYRALIVFVRFADDTAGSREWPVGLTAPPAFADGLISSSPVGPYADSTITRYFVDQSDPANPFILFGDVYPEVLVTDNNEFDYYNHSESCVGQDSGFGVTKQSCLRPRSARL